MYKTRKSYPKRDLTGQKFGMLTPIEWLRGGYWICQCDCGNEAVVDTRMLMNGHTKSCGCLRYASKNVTDMIGYEDENLKVISRQGVLGEAAGDFYDITVEHDRRKREFCERHRVKFKVISYDDPCETLSDILD